MAAGCEDPAALNSTGATAFSGQPLSSVNHTGNAVWIDGSDWTDEMLVVFAHPVDARRSSLTVMRTDVTTLDASEVDPALDRSVNVDGVDCFVSSWFAQNVTRTRLDLSHPPEPQHRRRWRLVQSPRPRRGGRCDHAGSSGSMRNEPASAAWQLPSRTSKRRIRSASSSRCRH